MAIRVFSDEDLERLRSFPEINREELIRFFTLTPADVEFIDPGRGRGPSDRLGLAVQLCTLPWLGFVPDAVTLAPAIAVARLSERLQVPVSELRAYGERDQTRTDHLRSAARYLGWRQASALELDELAEFSDENLESFAELDDALTRLAQLSPRQGRLLQYRYFGGLSLEESAAAEGVSLATTKRELRSARAWLAVDLKGDSLQ